MFFSFLVCAVVELVDVINPVFVKEQLASLIELSLVLGTVRP